MSRNEQIKEDKNWEINWVFPNWVNTFRSDERNNYNFTEKVEEASEKGNLLTARTMILFKKLKQFKRTLYKE